MQLNIVLTKNGKEMKSFNTEDESYLETGSVTVGNIIEREVYSYNRISSKGSRIVFSCDTEIISKHVASLEDLI